MNTFRTNYLRIVLVMTFVIQILVPGRPTLAQSSSPSLNDTRQIGVDAETEQMLYGRIDGDGITDLQQLQVYAINTAGLVVDAATVDAQGRFTFRPLPVEHYQLRVMNRDGIDVALTTDSQFDAFPGEGRRELRLRLLQKSSAENEADEQPSVLTDEATIADPLPALLRQEQTAAENEALRLQQNHISVSAPAIEAQPNEEAAQNILLPEDRRPSAFVYLPLVTQNISSHMRQGVPDTAAQASNLTEQRAPTPDTTYEVAAGDGVISGRVTDVGTGDGVQDVYIYAREIGNKDSGNGYPNAGGYYTITGLLSGTYHVQFYPYSSDYLSEYYNNQRSDSSATPVIVNDAQTTPNVNATLDIGGKVTGRVTDKSGSTSLANCSVTLYNASTDSSSGYQYTNASGYYTFTNVLAGSYKVKFADCDEYLGEFYNNQTSQEAATPFDVSLNAITSNINGTLDKGGQITGRVTDFVNGDGIADVYVTVIGVDSGRSGYDYTDASGNYTITKLLADKYQVYFDAPYNSEYVDEYYNNQRNSADANPVAVVLNSTTTNINAALEKAGKITGRVTNSKGEGVDDVYVRLTMLDGHSSNYGYTDASGVYTLTGLIPGSYHVSFDPASNTEYVAEYYNNQHSADNANTLVITYNQVIANINAVLETGGRIIGRVTNNNGVAVQGAQVAVVALGGTESSGAYTDAAGYYTITRLLADSYRVSFTPSTGSDLVAEYFNNKHTQSDATPVVVSFNATASNINAQLERGGIVTGRVTNSSGTPMNNVLVQADSFTSTSNDGDTYTDVTGTYTISRLVEDTYRIQFTPPPDSIYVGEYYNNQHDYYQANQLTVPYNSLTSAVNAQLELGGQIKGHISDPTGKSLSRVKVSASTSDQFYSERLALSDASGNYTITGLLAGNYYVRFEPADDEHIAVIYPNQRLVANATLVAVILGNVTNGINATLPIGGKISGRVTDASSAGFANVAVTAYGSPEALYGTRLAQTDARGYYTVTALYPGLYYMKFDPKSERYLSEYYDNQLELVTSKPVTALLNSITRNINAQLSIGGQVTGKVTNASDDPLAGASVYAYSSLLDPTADASASTDASGVYTLTPLSAGAKYIRFVAPYSQDYASEYYNNKPTRSTADPVTVTLNQTLLAAGSDHSANSVPDINAVLEENAGSIRGKITDNEGTALKDVTVYAYASPVENHYEALATSDTSGNYTITALAPGNYYLHFYTFNDAHLSEYYNDQSTQASADPVKVNPNAVTNHIDVVLQKLNAPQSGYGSVTGKVTTSSGTAVDGALVSLYRSSIGGTPHASARTNAKGLYTITSALTGSYYAFFSPPDTPAYQNYLAEYYNDKHGSFSANPITVTANLTATNINASLDLGGTMLGRVTDPSGQGITDVFVLLSLAQGGNTVASAKTDATGTYTVSKLAGGAYYIHFVPPTALNFLSEYYNNQYASNAATPVTITFGVTTTAINAQLETGGSIQGVVKAADSNKPLAGVLVSIYNTNECNQFVYVGSAITDASGHYTATRLATGNYLVGFFPPDDYSQPYLYQYYNNQESFPGNSVSVTAGNATTGINAQLQRGGQIAGKITAADLNVPLADVRIWIYRESGGNFRYYEYVYTDAEGNYVSDALPAGNYKVEFDTVDSSEAKSYLSEYYNDQPSFASASVINVAKGSVTKNINGALARGGQIAGTIVDEVTLNGIPFAMVSVYTTTVGSPYPIARATASFGGSYLTPALPAGTYYLSFQGSGYLVEFYNDKPGLSQATAVNVSGTTVKNGIDAGLKFGAAIQGTVRDETGSGLYDIRVTSESAVGNTGVAYTDSSGNYLIRGLPSDSYRVTFHGETITQGCKSKQYGTIYYNQRTRLEDADLVTVVVPDRSNIAIHGASADETSAIPSIAYDIDAILPLNGDTPTPTPTSTPIPEGGAKTYLPVVQR